jgi:general secretion pathway protein D
MEVNQEIKQPSNGVASAAALKDTTLTLATRKLKTVIVVNNGDTAVLGGLMKDEEREVVQKVPLLGDIPILGWLFKSTSHTKEKVNMVVFLTPKIIRSSKDAKDVVAKKINDRIEHVKSANGGRDPFGKKVDEIMRKTAYDGIKADEDNRDRGGNTDLPSEKN